MASSPRQAIQQLDLRRSVVRQHDMDASRSGFLLRGRPAFLQLARTTRVSLRVSLLENHFLVGKIRVLRQRAQFNHAA